MHNRKKTVSFILIQIALVAFILFSYLYVQNPTKQNNNEIAAKLLLNELCLTTEARHTRHPGLADIFTPFQDFPGGSDHFPSSTFIQLPAEYIFTDSLGKN